MAGKDDIPASLEDLPTGGDTFAELRGRQSVRATFKLTDNCIEAISIIAAQLGIKQKSLFDHLFQDTQSLSSIARKFRDARLHTTNRIQKTYVISRSALLSLEDIARSFNAPRDVLIEFSVQRLLPIIAKERKRHDKRKTLFKNIQTVQIPQENIGNHRIQGIFKQDTHGAVKIVGHVHNISPAHQDTAIGLAHLGVIIHHHHVALLQRYMFGGVCHSTRYSFFRYTF